MTGALLALAVLLPLAMLAGCVVSRLRRAMPGLLAIAPIPGLLAAIACRDAAVWIPGTPFRLALTEPGALLLGASSILWILAALTVRRAIPGRSALEGFSAWWLLTLTGSLGVFVAADLISFYLLFSIVSLSAYGLIAAGDGPSKRTAISVYIALAVVGEAFLLLAFVLLASPRRARAS